MRHVTRHPNIVRIMATELSDIAIAKYIGVHRSTVHRWRKDGVLPNTNDLEELKRWHEQQKTSDVVVEGIEVHPVDVEGTNPLDVRDRLAGQEKASAGEIAGIENALAEARSTHNDKAVTALSLTLRSARKAYKDLVDSLLKAEQRVLLIQQQRGALITVDAAKEFVTKKLMNLKVWAATLPNQAKDGNERELLTRLQESINSIIRAEV
jgi:hypothetical protein